MNEYQPLSADQRRQLAAQGCTADDWDRILVTEDFSPACIAHCGFGGEVRIAGEVTLRNVGTLANCDIRRGARIEQTAVVETVGRSSFGCGTPVAVINEGGGREVPLYPALTTQTAYLIALFRHRPEVAERLGRMIEREYTVPAASSMGTIGERASIRACGILRNVCIGPDAVLEGVSSLANGTVCSHAGQRTYLGADVRLRDFIVCGNSIVENGTTGERCFFGNGTHASALSVTDSLLFAGSHCENGELCSVLAGPYTISHHKSTLLIAGLFSFFNAGSGTNQSNHLLKSGPVHQGIHQRGCKYGSDAYMMLPALDGAFTTVIGRHKCHPDTSSFPFSLLIEQEGQSWLMPAANLAACGPKRDFAKWPARDRRDAHATDLIRFEAENPYLAERIARGLALCEELQAKATGDVVIHQRLRIRTAMLRRGIRLYRLAYERQLGAMLAASKTPDPLGEGGWTDLCGLYMPVAVVNALLEAIADGSCASLEHVTAALRDADARYPHYAAGWALARLTEQLGHTPTPGEIETARAAGLAAAEQLDALAADDLRAENAPSMAVGYGLDMADEEARMADFHTVRNL